MKKVRITIPNLPLTSRRYESYLELDEEANFVDVIMKVDEEISGKAYSLTHSVWDPFRNRIYNQVAMFAYVAEPNNNLSPRIRSDPRFVLPDGVVITLQPSGPCITDWEDPIDYNTFLKGVEAYKKDKTKSLDI
ncbi:MAG: hypothetical protein QXF26_00265 [Candidatus Bathyarchaeia archaeon]